MKNVKDEKILGEKRRSLLLKWLKEADTPLKGSELATKTNVSRQVIVQDISLLKAKNEPIIATSQGYLFLQTEDPKGHYLERIIACKHDPSRSKVELILIVDHGVTVKDVIVEHPVYGDLTASIMVSNRKEVEGFIKKIQSSNAAYLSQLTDGLHLHTLSADSEEKLDNVCRELEEAGFLVNE